MWDMQKIIIKAHPTAQLAQPHHATREQVLLSLTPGVFVGLGKSLGNEPAFPGTRILEPWSPCRAEVTQLTMKPGTHVTLTPW